MWYVTCEVEDDVRACEVEDDVVCDMRSGGWHEGLWGGGRCGMWHAKWREGLWGGGRCGMWHTKWRMTWGPVRWRTMQYVTCEVEDDVRACQVEDNVISILYWPNWRRNTLVFILYVLCKWKQKNHWKCFCVSKLSKYFSGTKVTEPRKFWSA